jgi:hypothetical protein
MTAAIRPLRTSYSEAAYFDGVPVQHVADWEFHQRIARIEREGARLVRRLNRNFTGRI